MKRVIKIINNWFCKHDWRIKGNEIDNEYFTFSEYRCCKCKVIKQKHIIK